MPHGVKDYTPAKLKTDKGHMDIPLGRDHLRSYFSEGITGSICPTAKAEDTGHDTEEGTEDTRYAKRCQTKRCLVTTQRLVDIALLGVSGDLISIDEDVETDSQTVKEKLFLDYPPFSSADHLGGFLEKGGVVFQHETVKPKVQVAWAAPPGACPHEVVVERRRRFYASLDLEEMLLDAGLVDALLVPPPDPELASDRGVPHLPLEMFDDKDFDSRTPEEWLLLGKIEGEYQRNPIPARAFLSAKDDDVLPDSSQPSEQLVEKRESISSSSSTLQSAGLSDTSVQMTSKMSLSSKTSQEGPAPRKLFYGMSTNPDIYQHYLPVLGVKSHTTKGEVRVGYLVQSTLGLYEKKEHLSNATIEPACPPQMEKVVRKRLPESSRKSLSSDDFGKLHQPFSLHSWANVAVKDYDPQTDLWLVDCLDNWPFREEWVARPYLIFDAEDPRLHVARLVDAADRRAATEALIRFRLALDCLPSQSAGIELTPQVLWRITKIAFGGWKASTLPPDALPRTQAEVQRFYASANAIAFFKRVANEHAEWVPFLFLLPEEHVEVPANGKVKVPEYNFAERKRKMRFMSLLTQPEVLAALVELMTMCEKTTRVPLFTLGAARPSRLEEYISLQQTQLQQTLNYLQEMWVPNVVNMLKEKLGPILEGWYNIHEHRWEIYLLAKLSKLMTRINFTMKDTLRSLVYLSTYQLVKGIEDLTRCTWDCPSDLVWSEDLHQTPFKPKGYPLFFIELKVDATSTQYSTPPEAFPDAVILAMDTALRASHTIPDVEPLLMQNLRFEENLCLGSVGLIETLMEDRRERVRTCLKSCVVPLEALLVRMKRYQKLFELDPVTYIADFKLADRSAAEVGNELESQKVHLASLEAELPSNQPVGPFYVSMDAVRSQLIQRRRAMYAELLAAFCRKVFDRTGSVCSEYIGMMRKLQSKPADIKDVADLRQWMEGVPALSKVLEDVSKAAMADYDLLERMWVQLSNEEASRRWQMVGWPRQLAQALVEVTSSLDEETTKMLKLQQADWAALNDRIDSLGMATAALGAYTDIGRAQETAQEVRRLWKQAKECEDTANKLNERQLLFGLPLQANEGLNRLLKEMEPYRSLWVTVAEWMKLRDSWLKDPMSSVDPDIVEKTLIESSRNMAKCIRTFVELDNVRIIAEDTKIQLDDFKQHLPLIQALRNPGMRQRHWEQLSDETGIKLVVKTTTNFEKCLQMGLSTYVDAIARIGETAGKEYAIEQTLDKMQHEWEPIMLDIMPYKDTGTYIMSCPEEVTQQLDDHIVMTQAMVFSPYREAFVTRIMEWEKKLRLAQDALEQWVECQRSWLYLEAIFSSPDIAQQLPLETKLFQSMERTWRRVMKNAKENPQLIDFCADQKLVKNMRECNQLLVQVEKGLSEYLETKRLYFPRFYFLSDDELLEILSQTRDPSAVQPHLRKCFESIHRLRFESPEKGQRITAMMSAEGEVVEFRMHIQPTSNVEEWLSMVEEAMRESLRLVLADSLVDYLKVPRDKWVLQWPGQLVIAGGQVFWSAQVENAISVGALADYYSVMLKQLDGLRELVKGDLLRVEREVLSALIVIEVHARDVVSTLVTEQVASCNDFEWISQLRYYWLNDSLVVRAVNAEFPYGFEYLGNSGRLVITPLTDRCYLTLTGALHLKFGGAPAGPAGTGKTETTKDLAKAMAVQCVVFNCSDQLDVMAMGKFFKGLATAGAWACFDEFNRIDVEVLSVVAQQITTIQKAQAAHAERFVFEGMELSLKASCAVFITMNPGYAGRTELPDNLKALFRPVAMMVPNYTLIAEISLFSFGFSEAKLLAGKITTTFKLSSEQLSAQDHYDFGMRAVKTVIAAAGNLKREQSHLEEDQIVLRAIRDVNVPKFLQDDLKLFDGIVSDLFPGLVMKQVDYGSLELSIRKGCKKMLLEDVDAFVMKTIQLYETTVVRHGLMLVGPTGSGKTKCYKVLQAALNSLKGEPSPSGQPFQGVHAQILNPKSITMGQLYGEFNMMTHEWTDGVLASLMRGGASTEDNTERHWYILDGPVDAVWIENLNTVLDDNKKLCLTSGEIIILTSRMTMMFEVADLAVASPATVSRCGMVYLEPRLLGLQPFITCWLLGLPKPLIMAGARAKTIMMELVEPAIKCIRSDVKEMVPSADCGLVASLLKLMESLLAPFLAGEPRAMVDPRLQTLPNVIEYYFLFSLVWSVGATCDNDGRNKFDYWLRNTLYEKSRESNTFVKVPMLFPEEGLVYDYRLDDGGTNNLDVTEFRPPMWVGWMEGRPPYKIPTDQEVRYSDIFVPTLDTVRSSALLGRLVEAEKPVLCLGPTGTGKSTAVGEKLARGLPSNFIADCLVFSARTSANQTQDLVDVKLDKRRKGVYGPPLGKKMVFFVDDLNMPALEVYGAQPPIELLRQWMDCGGWYDRRQVGEFLTLVDVNLVGAMGLPGGGRNPVTARLLRHFNFLAFPEVEDSSKERIFGTVISWWLNKPSKKPLTAKKIVVEEVGVSESGSDTPIAAVDDWDDSVTEGTGTGLVTASIAVYNAIAAQLLPTPAKSHYTFNLRDMSKVFQGMVMAEAEGKRNMVRLWWHEHLRVFGDRLTCEEDRSWLNAELTWELSQHINTEMLVQTKLNDPSLPPPLFGHVLSPSSDNPAYMEMTPRERVSKALNELLDDYNQATTAPMKLVLFADAIEHTCRMSRVIRQPRGHALLLGVGGSGRRSLARLAIHAAELPCTQIELSRNYGMNEWREDLRRMLLPAGNNNNAAAFLLADTQLKSETFLEDLNSLLNSGDIPNLYPSEELEKIYHCMLIPCQNQGLPPTKVNLFATFTKRVRENVHVIFAMSPIGEVFRARLRQFPALVNCCTIDWFSEWPSEALVSVAESTLCQSTNDLLTSDKTVKGLVSVCQLMHLTSGEACVQFIKEFGRHAHVTPTSYLELLGCFSILLDKCTGQLVASAKRLRTGLLKLKSTQEEVAVLQVELGEMAPVLEEKRHHAEEMLEAMAGDAAEAEEKRASVQVEEQLAQEQTAATQAIADDAQRDLDEALPLLDEALSSLKLLSRNDIVEVRAMQRPPKGVVQVIEAVCIMKGVKPKRVPGEKPGEKLDDYWEVGKALLADPAKFLDSLKEYDKDHIPDEIIRKIEPYMNSETFQPEVVAKVSHACRSICMWVRAMYKYHFVALNVAPKRQALSIARSQLAETEAKLAFTKDEMQRLEDRLGQLRAALEAVEAEKAMLEARAALCEARLDRADVLLGGLAGEQVRWKENAEKYEMELGLVIGDVLLCAGHIAYLAPFTEQLRNSLSAWWLEALDEAGIPHTSTPTLRATFGDPVTIRNWQLAGLPQDDLSVDNAIMVQNSRRWPLLIDPQGQANKWIRNSEKEKGVMVTRLSDKDFLRILETAIRLGRACLLEGVGEELDPALETVLQRQTFKQGGFLVIKLGDSVVQYHESFRLYITTKLPNPSYSPELAVQVLLVNFALAPAGLEAQLLALVVAEERADLEASRNALVVSQAQMQQDLVSIENKILELLSSSEGSPVDDIDLIETLQASKVTSTEIKIKVAAAEKTSLQINATRSLYIPVAVRAQILFFCVADLAAADPMYQYSLEFFVTLFINSIQSSTPTDSVEERVEIINEHFTFNVYSSICRSLFEKHKLTFSFLMTARLQMHGGYIDPNEWMFLLTGGSSDDAGAAIPNPAPDWLPQRAWQELCALSNFLPVFSPLPVHVYTNLAAWKRVYDSAEPHRERLPGEFGTILDDFKRLLVLKAFRPDRITNAFQDFVAKFLGQRFVEPQTTALSSIFLESNSTTPLLIVLSPGTDPASDLYKFAEEMNFVQKLHACSLGQGQGPKAEELFKMATLDGCWLFFQNCHLAPSWMPSLERLVERMNPEHIHREFRLWLTSLPSASFPVSILQNGAKLTVEPPRGIKATLLKAYNTHVTKEFMESVVHAATAAYKNTENEEHEKFVHTAGDFRCLLFSLCLFHGVCLERRKFGALGFNIPYEFTDGDLRICVSQLKMFLLEYGRPPFKVLKYTAGEINYGGRVTDDWDRRCLLNVLGDYYCPEAVMESHCFDEDASASYYQISHESTHKEYLTYLRNLPLYDHPALFGLHANAEISFAQNEAYTCLATLLALQPKGGGGGGGGDDEEDEEEEVVKTVLSPEEIVASTARRLLESTPDLFVMSAIMESYPVLYTESLNTVLIQEAIRFNRLLSEIKQSLKDLLRALQGLQVMSQPLELMSNSLFTNAVPAKWASKAYPSLKPLGSWAADLRDRVSFLNQWVHDGPPVIFWVSGFFFPQAFLTGTLQNFARKHVISIDTIEFSFKVTDEEVPLVSPDDGCYIKGLYMEGARWDSVTHYLAESRPKELHTSMPPIWLVPEVNYKKNVDNYMCPVYKTLSRAGTLSTTGHSTNYVLTMELPSQKEPKHWVKRGVALICALNY